jgi:hypothetical protein
MKMLKWAAPAAMFLSLCGCGGDGKPAPVPATGKVMFNKTTPPVGALVVFHPKDPALAKAMSGTPIAKVQEDGTFALTSYAQGDGAPPGEYGVTIDWRPEPKNKPKFTLTEEGGGAKPALKPKYGDPSNPAFTVTVKKGEKNDFVFEVD